MSNIAILSVNHQLAPVAIREKVAFSQSELAPAISSLLSNQEIKACVVLSTCNRSEIFVTYDAENIREVLTKFLASTHGIEYSSLFFASLTRADFITYELYVNSSDKVTISQLLSLNTNFFSFKG